MLQVEVRERGRFEEQIARRHSGLQNVAPLGKHAARATLSVYDDTDHGYRRVLL